MRHISILAAFIVMSIYTLTSAQIPSPTRYYSLNNNSGREEIARKDGSIHGTTQAHIDRFGNANGAIEFVGDAYISTPPFFNNIATTCQNGATISFWLYIDENLTKKEGIRPWDDTDQIRRAFYASDEDQALLGFYHRRDRAVIDRYVLNTDGEHRNYGLWYWDPINFTDCQGWYQIFIVLYKNQTLLYMFFPNSSFEYSLTYMGIQDLIEANFWGLGGKNDLSVKVLDDFKVYEELLSKETIRTLHSRESNPNGMYVVTSAYDSNQCWQTHDYSTSTGCIIDLQSVTHVGYESTRQWVFEPIAGEQNHYYIRSAYTDLYLADTGEGSYLILDNIKGTNAEWILELSDAGYFLIKSAHSSNLYIKSTHIPFSTVRTLQLIPYSSAEAPYFKWRMNLLKTTAELQETLFITSWPYEFVNNQNTALGLIPTRPFTTSASRLKTDREGFPSLLDNFYIDKSVDDSYVIYSSIYPTKAMEPEQRIFSTNHNVEINDYNSGYAGFYRFIIDKPNNLGRKIRLRPIYAQTLSVYAGDEPKRNDITLKSDSTGSIDGHYWQIYHGGWANTNKQISTIEPGIYKIKTLNEGNRCAAPENLSWNNGSFMSLYSYNEGRKTSMYWIVDFERDSEGNPVRDGTYTIQLFGSDASYVCAVTGVSEGSKVKINPMNRDAVMLYKWFITPTRDGANRYYIQSAENKTKYLHCKNNIGTEGNPLDVSSLPLVENTNESYKWLMEKVTIPTPLQPGEYKISIDRFQVRGRNGAQTPGTVLEIFETGGLTWEVSLNSDNTYFIKLKGQNYYFHTKFNSYERSGTMEMNTYNNEQSHTYRWLITKNEAHNAYQIQLVGNPGDGYIHLQNNALVDGVTMEIYYMVEAVLNTYLWKFEPIQ